MQCTHWCAAIVVAWGMALAPATAARAAVDVSGAKFEEKLELQGTRLSLNGAGVRFKTVFKVYAAGLYLEQPAATTDQVFAASGPKRLEVAMLREIDSAELGRLFTRSISDNMDKTAFSRIVPGVMRMSQIFSECKKLQAGDRFSIEWVPGKGTLIEVKKCFDQPELFKEPEFFNALMGIWLGPVPADWKLKSALLGKPEKGNP